MALPRRTIPSAVLAALDATTALTPPLREGGFVYRERKPLGGEFIPSAQQAAFFEWVDNGSGSALLEAVAGAGKTTTLIQALRRMEGTVFFGAYNKKIADEIKAKAEKARVTRSGIYINTMHGSGYSDWRRVHKQVVVDDRKVAKIIERLATSRPELPYAACATFIGRMVSFGKQFIIGVRGKAAIGDLAYWERLATHFSVDQDLPDQVAMAEGLRLVIEVYERSAAECPYTIDFDDMIFAPLFHNIRLYQNDWVLIDERQDTNPARRELAKRMLKRGGRLVAVGDSRQAIYGFTGADGGTEKFVEDFGCVQMPLTVTYRCPKAVVQYVRQWVSHIEAHPDAPEGVVRPVLLPPTEPGQAAKPWFVGDAPGREDAVLCRYTKPLITTAFAMLRAGHACKVEGRDIGHGLKILAQRWKIKTLDRLEERLKAYLEREVAKARAAQNETREQQVADQVETLKVFIERCRAGGKTTIAELLVEIDVLFADNVAGVTTLSTGHKSKGREWGRVYWIQCAQRQRSLKDWEQVQEENIKYVIGTRAQAELILVPETLC